MRSSQEFTRKARWVTCLVHVRITPAFTCKHARLQLCSHHHATPSHRANTNGSSLAPRFHFTASIKAPLAHCSPSSSQSFLRTTDLPRPIFLNDHLNSPTIPTHRPYQLTDHTNSPTDPHQRPFLTDRTTDLPRTRPRTRVRRHPRSLSPLSCALLDTGRLSRRIAFCLLHSKVSCGFNLCTGPLAMHCDTGSEDF
jgi:hypothetical protein